MKKKKTLLTCYTHTPTSGSPHPQPRHALTLTTPLFHTTHLRDHAHHCQNLNLNCALEAGAYGRFIYAVLAIAGMLVALDLSLACD